MKTFREIAEMHYDSEPTSTIDRIYKNNRIEALEKLLTEQLRLHVVSQRSELLAISCLNNIINPIKYLTDLAEVDGGKLDGGFAVHLTRQGMFYQELAKKALKEIDNCG